MTQPCRAYESLEAQGATVRRRGHVPGTDSAGVTLDGSRPLDADLLPGLRNRADARSVVIDVIQGDRERSTADAPLYAATDNEQCDGCAGKSQHDEPRKRDTEHLAPEPSLRLGVSTDGHIHPFPARHPGGTAEHRSRSEEHTSELQSRENLVCRLLLE